MPDIKTIAIFLPFLAAVLIGVTYTANGKLLGTVNLTTYLLIYCLTGIALVALLHIFSSMKIDFSSLTKNRMAMFVAASVLSSILAWTSILIAIPQTSAIYTAAGEIAYPLFVALFGYVLFRNEITWSTACGGLLIMAGSFILITGKLKGWG